MTGIIDFGGLQIRFLQSKITTGGALDMFEMTVHPGARMPVPHYHESWEETVYGLAGTTAFVPRGIVHGCRNDSGAVATCLVVLTPGALGSAYFEELAAFVQAGEPDPEAMGAVMRRYGLIPARSPTPGSAPG